jgi:hypothetical protein
MVIKTNAGTRAGTVLVFSGENAQELGHVDKNYRVCAGAVAVVGGIDEAQWELEGRNGKPMRLSAKDRARPHSIRYSLVWPQ